MYTLRKEGEARSASPSGEYKMRWAQILKSLDYRGSGKKMTGQIQSPAVWVCKCTHIVYLFCYKETSLDNVGRMFVKGNDWKCFLKDFVVWQWITLALWIFFSLYHALEIRVIPQLHWPAARIGLKWEGKTQSETTKMLKTGSPRRLWDITAGRWGAAQVYAVCLELSISHLQLLWKFWCWVFQYLDFQEYCAS